MRTFQRIALYGALLALALAGAACGANRESALTQDDAALMKGQAQGDFARVTAEGDALWEKRGDRASLEQALVKWEEATTIATPDLDEDARRKALAEVYTKLTHGYYFLADAHIRFSEGKDAEAVEEEMKAVFNKGITAAEKGLGVYSKEFAQQVRREAAWPDAIKGLDKGATPMLYWYSSNMGKWALLEGFTEILSRKDDIKATMDLVEAQNGEYFYAAPFRYFGVYYTRLPFPGGDPPKSKEYFDKAIAVAPGYLANRVLMAENYATKVGDKDLYRKELEAVLAFDLAQAPELEPENRFEQKKARQLLDQIDDNF